MTLAEVAAVIRSVEAELAAGGVTALAALLTAVQLIREVTAVVLTIADQLPVHAQTVAATELMVGTALAASLS